MYSGVPTREPVVVIVRPTLLDRARDAEVGETACPREQNVLRLDVAVDDVVRVRVRERFPISRAIRTASREAAACPRARAAIATFRRRRTA